MQSLARNPRSRASARALVLIALAFVFLVSAARLPAQEELSVAIVAVSPDSPAALAPREGLYLRIVYRSAKPLRFQASGSRSGRKVEAAMMNPSPVYPAGEGEAIAWIAYASGAVIDEARVMVCDERWEKITEVSIPVDVKWSSGTAARADRAPWVKQLNDAQQRAVSTAMRAQYDGGGPLLSALMWAVMWLVPGYPAMQIWALIRLRGTARLVSALPLIVMIPTYGYCLLALLNQSNLWPLWMIFLSPPAFLYVLVVWLVSRKRMIPA